MKIPQALESIDRRSRALGLAVFTSTLLVNLLSANPGMVPLTAPDTIGYLDVTRQLLRGEAPYLHVRTPGYPLFLLLAELTGSWRNIVWIQAIVGALAAVGLWRILLTCIRSSMAALASVALFGAYGVSSWHGIALTESLSISLVVLWAFVHLAYLGAVPAPPMSRRGLQWVVLALDVLLMMQRPAFFFLPALWYSAVLAYRLVGHRWHADDVSKLPGARPLAVHLMAVVLVTVAWCGMIGLRYGRFEISILTRFARLGNLMSLGFASPDTCLRRPCSPLLRRGVELASNDSMRIQGPFPVIVQLEAEYPGVPRGAILDSLNAVLMPAPKALVRLRALRRAEFILGQRGLYNSSGSLFRLWPYRVYSNLSWRLSQRLSDAAVLWTAVYIVLYYRLKRRLDWVRVILLGLVLYTAGVTILAAYEGWDRLMAPAVVPLNVLILLFALDVVRGALARLRTTDATKARSMPE